MRANLDRVTILEKGAGAPVMSGRGFEFLGIQRGERRELRLQLVYHSTMVPTNNKSIFTHVLSQRSSQNAFLLSPQLNRLNLESRTASGRIGGTNASLLKEVLACGNWHTL